jgi:hypothetical protein
MLPHQINELVIIAASGLPLGCASWRSDVVSSIQCGEVRSSDFSLAF